MNRNIHSGDLFSNSLAADWHAPSFWMERLPDAAPAESLRGAHKCDLAIIGGGFTGLSTAYHARRLMPGIDVRVVEGNLCGHGSSGRNAGFASPLFGMRRSITAMRFGRDNAIAAHRYMLDAIDYLERLVQEHTIECDFERPGMLLVANSAGQARRLEKETHITHGRSSEGVDRRDRKQLADEFKTGYYSHAVFEKHCALLNPARLARGLMRIAQEAGSIVYERSPALRIEEFAGGYTVLTPGGELHCERIVFALNAYSVLLPRLSSRQTPIYQAIVLSEPLTDEQLESVGWQSRVGFVDVRNLIHYYRLTADNRILIGGGDILPGYAGGGLKFKPDSAAFAHLKQHLIRVYPQLKGLQFSHQWGGIVSVPLDLAPTIGYVGRDRRGIYSTGLMGHGVSMTPYNGLCIAELLANQTSERTEMFFVGRKATSWPPHFIRYPMLQAGRFLLKLQDRLQSRGMGSEN